MPSKPASQKTSSSTKGSAKVEEQPAVVSQPVAAPAPTETVSKKTSKSSKKSTETTAVVEQPVVQSAPAPVSEQQTTTAISTEGSSDQSVEDRFKSVLSTLDTLTSQIKVLKQDLTKLHKKANQELKDATKKADKRRGKKQPKLDENGNVIEAPKPVSGIVKPTDVSEEICQFMNQPKGTKLARTQVTKFLTDYIKEHNLQNPENKREIKPDDKLKNLLKITEGEVLTYFNLQTKLKHHFPKAQTPVVASS